MRASSRAFVTSVAVTFGWIVFGATEATATTTARVSETARSCIPADQCCQICTGGRACGKSCISAKKTCHKGRGCACNAEEVCE